MTATTLASLPDALAALFTDDPATGETYAWVYSAVDARDIEIALAEMQASYRTRIVRSRKRGVYYHITLLDEQTHLENTYGYA